MRIAVSMKTASVWALLVAVASVLVAGPAAAQEQEADTTFLNRNIRQQMFLLGYLKANKPESPPATEAEVETYIKRAAEAWADQVEAEDPLVGQLNPYVARWLLSMAYVGTGSEPPERLACYNYAEHVIPAFLADFERYREVDPAHAALVRWGYDWAGGPLALGCEIGAERWSELQTAFEKAPSVFQSYLDAKAYPDEQIGDQIRQAQQFFEWRAPLYAIRGALYRGDLDLAFADLAAATTQDFGAYDLRPLGKALWQAYDGSGQTDHALATLDLIARTLTAGDLSRDTLRAWYAEVEPERGIERFELMTASAPSALVQSDERVDLSGRYTDLLTDETVDLENLEGKLVLLDFWATWCTPCIAEIPALRALVAEHGDRIMFVSVNADAVTGAEGPDGVRAFMEKHEVDYSVLYDDPGRSLAVQFGVRGYPSKFLISPDGLLLVHPVDGRRTIELDEVRAHLEESR